MLARRTAPTVRVEPGTIGIPDWPPVTTVSEPATATPLPLTGGFARPIATGVGWGRGRLGAGEPLDPRGD